AAPRADRHPRLGRAGDRGAGGVGRRPAGDAGDGVPAAAQRGDPAAGGLPHLPGHDQLSPGGAHLHRRRLAGRSAALRCRRKAGAGAFDPRPVEAAAGGPGRLRARRGLVPSARPVLDLLRPPGAGDPQPDLPARRRVRHAACRVQPVHPGRQRTVEHRAARGRRRSGQPLRHRRALLERAELPGLGGGGPAGRVAGRAAGPATAGRRPRPARAGGL
ncbi:MAG: hypothetical protein AVDCRST_MAG61-1573, partial [uncultured Friedmanniella sp.]